MTETSVTVASGQTRRKVVGIATSAISSGTIAMKDAKTNARTRSAPTPATSASTTTLVPPPVSPSAAAARSASRPVTATGEPATVTPASAAWAVRASAWPGSTPPRAGMATRAKVVRPSVETKARSCVEA